MSNPFGKFVTKTSKVKIKALNATVEVREPTVSEVADFYKAITDDEGKVNGALFFDAKIERIASCMIEPKMTVEELTALSAGATEAINEVYEAIEALSAPKGKEGNVA